MEYVLILFFPFSNTFIFSFHKKPMKLIIETTDSKHYFQIISTQIHIYISIILYFIHHLFREVMKCVWYMSPFVCKTTQVRVRIYYSDSFLSAYSLFKYLLSIPQILFPITFQHPYPLSNPFWLFFILKNNLHRINIIRSHEYNLF